MLNLIIRCDLNSVSTVLSELRSIGVTDWAVFTVAPKYVFARAVSMDLLREIEAIPGVMSVSEDGGLRLSEEMRLKHAGA